jgi:hypothetical protein
VVLDTIHHFFPELWEWMGQLDDPRDPETLHYTMRHLLSCGMLMFLLHLRSRNQFRWERLHPLLAQNVRILASTDEETVAHPDTVAVLLERLDPAETAGLLAQALRRLIRMKALDDFRVRGHFLVAVDGTGYLCFEQRHCEHCVETKHASGKTLYSHPVLAAFLVGNGMALPLAVEFVENPSEPFDKQDCELKAFARLAPRLKKLFPQTPFCLLLDALYAAAPVMDICQRNQWKFFITFKESDMSALWREAVTLRDLCPHQNHTIRFSRPGSNPPTQCTRLLQWVNDLDHQEHRLSALWQRETTPEGTVHFAHITNWTATPENIESFAVAARQRWRIENEGFNVLKNGGFDLEHAYSRNFNASKNYFHLMLLAHLLQQLIVRGSLFTCFRKQLGSCLNWARRLAEHLRSIPIALDTPAPHQIRFCSD